MFEKIENFLQKYEILILLLLLAAMLLVNSQGLSWGLPGLWNPDEISHVVNLALDGLFKFDQTNLNYPSLPKYFMLTIGRITDTLGYSRTTFFIVVRFISVFLGGLLSWLAYVLVRRLGGKRLTAFLALLIVAANGEIALNSHFAHNDLYVSFFTCMAVFFLVRFYNSQNKGWLYAAFYATGMAASSKYNGGIILLLVILVYFWVDWKNLLSQKLRVFETLFVGAGLSVFGYAIGTPQLVTWSSYYIKRLIPTLADYANYDKNPASVTGLYKQWGVFRTSLGDITYYLFIIALTALLILGLLTLIKRYKTTDRNFFGMMILAGAIIILDLPILISFNVQKRFFLPIIPMFAVILTLMAERLITHLKTTRYARFAPLVLIIPIAVFAFSALRQAGTIVAIKNDARIPAGEFINTLPAGSSMEITQYTPNLVDGRFDAQMYPLYFLKYENEELPQETRYEYNTGEVGVEVRKPEYLVISSYIYSRFNNEFTCQKYPAECDFFQRLQAGETNYNQIGEFKYTLPPYLPKLNLVFINPIIQVYERVEKTK